MAWGEVTPASWVHLVLDTARDPLSFNTWLTLSITIDAVTITNPYFPIESHGGVPTFTRPKGRWGSRTVIGDKDDRKSPHKNGLVSAAMRSMILNMAFLVREHDPRIGKVLESGSTSFPPCPLFDPPRMRPPRWIWAPALDSVPCPFCQQPFEHVAPAMWSGGNLLWAHPACWAQVHS